jgi:uroporphyrinogen decarboxylase
LETCLSGEKPDRLPIALWRHFPVADQDPHRLARAALDYQNRYDFDLIKVTPASSYCLLDWGIKDEWKGNPEGTRDYSGRVIHAPDDWLKLKVLDPRAGDLGLSLEALKLILNGRVPATPVLQTIFNPLSQAKNLAGQETLLAHLHHYPEELAVGLETITATIQNYLTEVMKLGVDGIFYAVQHAQSQLLTPAEFQRFSIGYDLSILNTVQSLWLNMLHIHGTNVLFDQVANYPVQVVNWHDRETSIHLDDGLKKISGVACGGLSRDETMMLGSPEQVIQEIQDGYEQTGGRRWILGTGCVMMTTTPEVNILAALQASRLY